MCDFIKLNSYYLRCEVNSKTFLWMLLPFLFSCKKKSSVEIDISPPTGTRTELTIDSLYLYAKEIYLWNESLPSYSSFAPRDRYSLITSEINALNEEIFDITQFKINEKTKMPYEFTNYGLPKYSYIEKEVKGVSKSIASSVETLNSNKIVIARYNNISYIALHSFPKLNDIKSDFDDVFLQISSYNSDIIVVDLRYNNGGYVETVEYLANLIAPSKLNGKLMYSESFNQMLQSRNAKILRNQPYLDNNGNTVIINGRKATMADVDYSEKGNTYFFKKQGNLESVKNIYFITSGKTASASELLISLFKPYFNVKLVGEKTYGKPVGFFPIHIDKYSFYLSSFLIKNAVGWFDYFDNMQPHIKVTLPSNPNLGHPEEPCLKSIISDVNGTSKITSAKDKIIKQVFENKQQTTEEMGSNGVLIENRLRLKEFNR